MLMTYVIKYLLFFLHGNMFLNVDFQFLNQL